jgi:hypothetical protein
MLTVDPRTTLLDALREQLALNRYIYAGVGTSLALHDELLP